MEAPSPAVHTVRASRRDVLKGFAGALGGVAAGAVAGCGVSAAPEAEAQCSPGGRLPDRSVDVAVIGGGISGLTAARRLAQAGRSVVVLEANDRVGGRTLSHSASGAIAELGGTWVGPTQDRVLALADELDLTVIPQYNEGQWLYYGHGLRLPYSDTLPTGATPPDPLVLPDVPALLRIDQMAAQVPVEAPWLAPQAAEWDRQTLDSWMRDNTLSEQTRRLMSAALETITGTEASEISLLSFLHHVAGAGNAENVGTFARLTEIRNAGQESRIAEGTQQLSIRMAAALGEAVVLSSPVRRIRQNGAQVVVESDRLVVNARHAIVAIPPTLAGRIEYEPVLPGAREQLQQRTAMGWLIKCEAVYDTPFWRTAGLTGSTVSDTGPAKLTFDVSPVDGHVGVMLGFVGGDVARKWSARPRAELQAAVIDNFVAYFGEAARNPREFLVQDWGLERWSGGSPIAFTAPGVLVGLGEALTVPVGRIHWAGTETSPYWHGFMDGAVRAGEAAASAVLAQS